MSIKIVLDTNVLIGALLGPSGANREVLRRCFAGKFLPLIGNTLFCEYEAVFSRPEILKKCRLNPDQRIQFFASFLHICEWVKISYLWRPNLYDEKDNFLIELAVAGNADFLLTNNLRDFREMELSFPGLKILSPIELLKEV